MKGRSMDISGLWEQDGVLAMVVEREAGPGGGPGYWNERRWLSLMKEKMWSLREKKREKITKDIDEVTWTCKIVNKWQ